MEKPELPSCSSGNCRKLNNKRTNLLILHIMKKGGFFMKEKAVYYYNKGYNCSQCMLKAAEKYYGLNIPEECYDLCKGLNTGLGIGGTCSLISAATMIFGLLFDEKTVKRLRMRYIDAFHDLHKAVNCSQLKSHREYYGNCSILIGEAAELLEQIIAEEKKKY